MHKIENIILKKKSNIPITCLTAYTHPIAKIIDRYCDIILVGDSLGMTIYGHENTLNVTLDMMINHGKAVCNIVKNALTIIDLPYGSYEKSKEQSLKTAQKVIKETKCDAIKIEIDENMIEIAEFLVKNGINLMGHIGLLPQHIKEYGGYKYQGKDISSSNKIKKLAKQIEDIGVFSFVIEAVPAILASEITKLSSIPVIGIGASENCDGQILVIDDMIGLNTDFKPKFVENYANIAYEIEKSCKKYKSEVENRIFPYAKNMVEI